MPSSDPWPDLPLINDSVDMTIDTYQDDERLDYGTVILKFKGKYEQRYIFAEEGERIMFLTREHLTLSERKKLLDFYSARKGKYEKFQIKLPDPDNPGNYLYWKVRFDDKLSIRPEGQSITYFIADLRLKVLE